MPSAPSRVVFDTAGTVVARADYMPFGETLEQTAGLPPERFTGQERDPEVGQDYFNARYYAARLGRFTSVDPLFSGALADPQQWNRYAYARNSPLVFVDPTGLESCLPSNGCFRSGNDPIAPGLGGYPGYSDYLCHSFGSCHLYDPPPYAPYQPPPSDPAPPPTQTPNPPKPPMPPPPPPPPPLQLPDIVKDTQPMTEGLGTGAVIGLAGRLGLLPFLNGIRARFLAGAITSQLLRDPNRLNHIFADKHRLDIFGSRIEALGKLTRAFANDYLQGRVRIDPRGVFEHATRVDGRVVTFQGRVMNGRVHLSNAWRPLQDE